VVRPVLHLSWQWPWPAVQVLQLSGNV
jgi:hypothetical protein